MHQTKALGGHYRICALAEKDGGTIELTRGSHPYWSSLRPAGDPYWSSIHEMHDAAPLKVPRRTLDALVAETLLPGPYFIKMDIQGAEAAALRGAKRTLRNTEAVVIEVLMEDFAEIHDALHRQGLFLFDIAQLAYTKVDSLYSFYAVYLSGRRRELLHYSLFDTEMNAEMIRRQDERRKVIRDEVAASLARFREGRWPKLGG